MNFLTKLRNRIFPFIVTLTALAISVSAAFYSVTGLAALFAGASLAVIIMASTLEASKLVIASVLYQYRKTLNKAFKIYLSIALFILIMITSAGIYGFLTAAYQKTATQSEIMGKKIELFDSKLNRYQTERTELLDERSQLTTNISDLTQALGNNTIQYTNEDGELITTQSSSQRRVLQSNLDEAKERRNYVNDQLSTVNDSVASIEEQKLLAQSDTEIAAELGPLIFLSESTGKPMSWIINRLLLLIIFVFDPLAISLVIVANFAFEQVRIKEEDIDESNPESPSEPEVVEIDETPEIIEPAEVSEEVVVEKEPEEVVEKVEPKPTPPTWQNKIKRFIKK